MLCRLSFKVFQNEAQLRNSRGCGCSLSPMYPWMRGLLGKERRKPTLLREQVEQNRGSIARNLERPMHAKWKPPCMFRSIKALKTINLHTHIQESIVFLVFLLFLFFHISPSAYLFFLLFFLL